MILWKSVLQPTPSDSCSLSTKIRFSLFNNEEFFQSWCSRLLFLVRVRSELRSCDFFRRLNLCKILVILNCKLINSCFIACCRSINQSKCPLTRSSTSTSKLWLSRCVFFCLMATSTSKTSEWKKKTGQSWSRVSFQDNLFDSQISYLIKKLVGFVVVVESCDTFHDFSYF